MLASIPVDEVHALQADAERGQLHEVGAEGDYLSLDTCFTADSSRLALPALGERFSLRIVPCQDGLRRDDAATLAHEGFRGVESFVCLPGCIVVSMPLGLGVFDVGGALRRTLVHEVPCGIDRHVPLLACSVGQHRLAVLPLGRRQPGGDLPAGLIVYDTRSWQLLFSQPASIPRAALTGYPDAAVVCLGGLALASAPMQPCSPAALQASPC